MNEINLNIHDFIDSTPNCPGKYLRCFDGAVSLITVVRVPAENCHGIKFDSYLGVSEYRRSNVSHMRGKFVKLNMVDLKCATQT